MRRTVTTLWPLWAISLAIAIAQVLLGNDRTQPVQIALVDGLLFVVCVAALPFVAGYFYQRRFNSGLLGATLAGVSIRLADVLGVGVGFLVLQASSFALAFAGFILATAMFAVLPSALFGFVGGWVARKYEPRHT